MKNFTVFAEQKQDGAAGKFFTALSSTNIMISPKRNPTIFIQTGDDFASRKLADNLVRSLIHE